MPLAKIDVEQLEHNRWVGNIEAQVPGGPFRRIVVRGDTFEEVWNTVYSTYRSIVPLEKPAVEKFTIRPFDEPPQDDREVPRASGQRPRR